MRSPTSSIPDTPPAAYTITTTTSPAKRKRSLSDPSVTPFAPRLNTDNNASDTSSHQDEEFSGARSPRTVVAERLSDLRIHGPLSVVHFNGLIAATVPEDRQRGKRRRRGARGGLVAEEGGEEEDDDVDGDEEDDHTRAISHTEPGGKWRVEDEQGLQIKAPKPQPRHRLPAKPPPGGTVGTDSQDTSRQAVPEQAEESWSLGGAAARSPTPMEPSTSLPIAAPARSTASDNAKQHKATSSSRRTHHPKKQAKRTADDTTHEAPVAPTADVLDPDDDGTGINGIGFRPTPAEAWARAQRRRKQLSDWRAREEREARERRSALRRSRGASSRPPGDAVSMDIATGTGAATTASTTPSDLAAAMGDVAMVPGKPRVRFAT